MSKEKYDWNKERISKGKDKPKEIVQDLVCKVKRYGKYVRKVKKYEMVKIQMFKRRKGRE